MAWGDDWLKNGLPTFDGGKDKSLARSMIDGIGGTQGFRTKIVQNADGSTTMLRTKNGMPQFFTEEKEKKQDTNLSYVETNYNDRTYHGSHALYSAGAFPLPFLFVNTVKLYVGVLIFENPPEDKLANSDYHAAIEKRSLDGLFTYWIYPPKRATLALKMGGVEEVTFLTPGDEAPVITLDYYTKKVPFSWTGLPIVSGICTPSIEFKGPL